VHVLPHRGGGAETYIAAVERGLGDAWRHERFALSAGRTPGAAVRSLPTRYPALWRAVRGADVVHVHGDMASVLALPVLGRRPTLMTTHGLHFLRRSEGAQGRAFGAALRSALGRCTRVLCTSRAERDELAAIAPDAPLAVVHNAVPPHVPVPRDRARTELGLPEDAVVVVFAGQLEERKRPLPAARAALAAGPHVVLLVAGEGPQEPELRALAGERVRLLGQVPDLGPLFAAADVYLAPADREGLSYALLEAMGAGLAIISSDTAGSDEAVGDAGVLVASGDETALARELAALAGDAERRAKLGAAARERARTEFADDAFAATMRGVYSAALAAR